MKDRRTFLQALFAATLASAARSASAAAPQAAGSTPSSPPRVQRQPLPDLFTGMDAAFTELHIQPGVQGKPHKHSGFVLGYVIEGQYLFAVNGETPRIVHAGEIFYEPPGATHTTSASANGEPAKVLAIVIGPQNAPIVVNAN